MNEALTAQVSHIIHWLVLVVADEDYSQSETAIANRRGAIRHLEQLAKRLRATLP